MMKKLVKTEFEKLHEKIDIGDTLVIPQVNKDKATFMYLGTTPYNLPNPYEAICIYKNEDGFITTLKDIPLWQPLAWTKFYNFKGAKLIKKV